MRENDVFDNMLDILNINCVSGWCSQIELTIKGLGFDKYIFGAVPNRAKMNDSLFVHSSYSKEWRSYYNVNSCEYIDPVVIYSKFNIMPVFWSDAIYKNDVQKKFREEAYSYGLVHGISFPLHGPSGEFGVFSLCLDCDDRKSANAHITDSMLNLIMLRDAALQSSLCFVNKSLNENSIYLTKREQQMLQWSSMGKTSWEISIICGCSESTVNFHISNVNRKFGVTSRHTASLLALKQGLIAM